MFDKIEIGPTPSDEACAQVGSDRYSTAWRAECRAFINQLRRAFGSEPEGAALIITSNPHDFGTYHDVACRYEEGNEAALAYALRCEAETPREWDDAAREELRKAGVCTAAGCDHANPVYCIEAIRACDSWRRRRMLS